jgi:hypothetical protein
MLTSAANRYSGDHLPLFGKGVNIDRASARNGE